MNYELKYLKYKSKYLALKREYLGAGLTPIFTEEPKSEPKPTPDPTKAEIPKFGKIEWNIDPEQPRNLRNNTSVKLTKPNGESFIVREGDYINYVSKSGFNPPKI